MQEFWEQGIRDSIPLGELPSSTRRGRHGHRDLDLPELRAHARGMATEPPMPRVRGVDAVIAETPYKD